MRPNRFTDTSPHWMLALFMALSLLILGLFAGCASTVTPEPVPITKEVAFDGGEQNAGILAVQADGAFVVTERVRARYNALIGEYGDRFLPALTPDAGLAPLPEAGRYSMTAAAMADYATMVQWRRMGRCAPK